MDIKMIGRLTQDIELKEVGNKKTVAVLNMAKYQKNKEAKACFLSFEVWGELAELCQKYINKGDLFEVEARFESNNYEKDGKMKYGTKMVVENVMFLSMNKNNKTEKVLNETNDNITDLSADNTADLPY